MRHRQVALAAAVPLCLTIGLLLLLIHLSSVAHATASTYYVRQGTSGDCTSPSTPCGSLQQAVDLAFSTGDEVWVATGTYTENLTIDHGVSVRGGWNTSFTVQDPAATPTTIDGRGEHVVRVENAPSWAKVAIQDLTLQNGKDGVHIWSGDVTVENCIIESADKQGIEIDGGTVLISATQILRTQQGIEVDDGIVQVTNVLISYAIEEGLLIEGGGAVTFTGSTIEYCSQQGVQMEQGTLWLFDNVIHNIDADGIRAEAGTASIISNTIYTVESDGMDVSGTHTISGNLVYNTGKWGIYGHDGELTIYNNTLRDTGGDGIRAADGTAVTIRANRLTDAGNDGIDARGTRVSVIDNHIDTTGDRGINAEDGALTIAGNVVYNTNADGIRTAGSSTQVEVRSNTVYTAGNDCIDTRGDIVHVSRNTVVNCTDNGIRSEGDQSTRIEGNWVSGGGVGLAIRSAPVFTITNNVIGGHITASVELTSTTTGFFYHNTLVGLNTDPQPIGVLAPGLLSLHLANNIVVSHSVSISATSETGFLIKNTLFWGNGKDPLTGTDPILAPPMFEAPAQRDYHLRSGSPAVDAGIDIDLPTDADGDPRPIGPRPDIGADEFPAALSLSKDAVPFVVEPGKGLTYTIRITNTGIVTLTTTITDTLPLHVTPGGSRTWTTTISGPGTVWSETVVITVQTGYTGPLVNIVRATTEEGAAGFYTHTLAPRLAASKQAHTDLVLPDEPLTYTLAITNTGNFHLNVAITDVLPAHVTPGGTRTWTTTLPAPDGIWTKTVVVTPPLAYLGPLINLLQATAEGGAEDIYTHTLAPALEVIKRATPNPVQAGQLLTYTIQVTNTGNFVLHATITDTLPYSVTLARASTGTLFLPGGTLFLPGGNIGVTWTATLPRPGDTWATTIVVTTPARFTGLLTNVVQVSTVEGVTTSYTAISSVIDIHPIYLPLVIRSHQVRPTLHSALTFNSQYPAPDGHHLAPSPQPSSPGNWWSAIQEDIRGREYYISPQTGSEAILGAYQAPNRAQNLRIRFHPTFVNIAERTVQTLGWSLDLAVATFGQRGSMTLLPPATLTASGNRVDQQRDELLETYINDQRGLEQVFQISDPQALSIRAKGRATNGESQTSLELALTTDLAPRLIETDRSIEFTDAAGSPILRYALLRATDAVGQPVPVQLEMVPLEPVTKPTSISSPMPQIPDHAMRIAQYALHIDARSASTSYPITLHFLLTSSSPHASAPSGLTEAWVEEGNQSDASMAYALSTAGDLNGDGFSDLVVGAPWYDLGQPDEGAVFVYPGSSTGLSSGATAWITGSNQAGARFGHAVSLAGDVNSDGYADIIVGAPYYDVEGSLIDAGQAFVYYGHPANLISSTAGWVAPGDQEDGHYGWSVSTAGDVNRDSISDVIVGAPDYDVAQADEGAAYVHYGSLTGLAAGPAGWMTLGNQVAARLGTGVSTAGDVNGDGYADVAISAPGYDITGTASLIDSGQIYVYAGGPSGLLTTTNELTATWTINGDQTGAHFGAALSVAGDVNGDGYSDLIVGAPDYDLISTATLIDIGRAYVFCGSSEGLTTGTACWITTGDQAGARLGAAVSFAGDVNSDGYADVVVGAPNYDEIQADEGAAFVYNGGPAGLTSVPTWSKHPTDQLNAHYGAAVSTAGDVNGDGHSDLAIGASDYNHGEENEGAAFVYHGQPSGLAALPTWSATGWPEQAVVGWSVSTAGDVNGDGYSDVIVGAPRYDRGQTEEGVAFLYHGGPGGPSTTPTWIGESNQAWAWYGHTVAAAGDVNGDGYGDLVVTANGYDGEALNEGAAFVYYGGPEGPITTTAWVSHPTDQADARFGQAAAAAGDVNGDGYSDVIITANGYDGEEPNEGAAFVYHGGPSGLLTTTAWVVHPTDQAYANFGRSTSTAGDVNGDGYSDVIIGVPWYDHPLTPYPQVTDGSAFVYHGGPQGLTVGPADWMVTQVFPNAECGIAVSTAGDVNGDGYSDVIIGAYKYTEIVDVTPWREGAAIAYFGSPTGLTRGEPDWIATGGQEQAKYGISVSDAGDVNGDGYSDVAVGASRYVDGESNEGAALVYHGGPTGLALGSADWIAQSNQEGAALGYSVSAAGDVNGDGYGDLIVGAPTYNGTRIDDGAAFIYLGNGGGGLPLRPHQLGVAPLGRTSHANQTGLGLILRSPLGREPATFQFQIAPLGVPFTATTVLSDTSFSADTSTAMSDTAKNLIGGTVYRWRIRTLYQPGSRLGQAAGRWLYLPWNGPHEADFRTPDLVWPDRESTIAPGESAVYTHTLHNPVGITQSFTLTAASSLGYTVTVVQSSTVFTTILPAFGSSLVTVTVQPPLTVFSGTDRTVLTATTSQSGYDTIRDVTTIKVVAAGDLSNTILPLILRGSSQDPRPLSSPVIPSPAHDQAAPHRGPAQSFIYRPQAQTEAMTYGDSTRRQTDRPKGSRHLR